MRNIYLIFFLLISISLSAQVMEFAEDDFGTCSNVRDNVNGTVVITTEQIRTGTAAFKHNVTPPPSGIQKRAEIDCGGFAQFDPNEVFWYGFSLYMPASDFPATLGEQFVNQLRFSNIPFGGFTVPNCNMNIDCGEAPIYGGSGHELLFQNGDLNFYLRYQEPGCADCEALDQEVFNLGSAPLDQWVDFVYQGKYTGGEMGFFRIWMQVNNGGYQLVTDYRGRSWVENHTAGSQLAFTGPGQSNPYAPRVAAPNYTVGLYYNDDNANRTMYSDHITLYQQEAGVDGFAQVSVAAVSEPGGCTTIDVACDDGNPNTFDDRINAICVCEGLPAGPILTPTAKTLGSAAGEDQFFVSSMTSWTVSDDADWLMPTAAAGSGDGFVTFTFTENMTGVDRVALVTVTDGNAPVTFTATQSGTNCGPTDWTAEAFTPQSGSFNLTYDVRAIGTTITDPIVGLSGTGNPQAFSDNGVLVAHSGDGQFRVRNGGVYENDAVVNYVSGTVYSFLLEVNGPARTYDVSAGVSGGPLTKIADDYAFRSDWMGSLPLDHLTTRSSISGCLEVTNIVVTQIAACTTAGQPCDDLDACTSNDVFDADCNCVGTLVDTDGDGICDNDDPCDNTTAGDACDDGDPSTQNDVIDENCNCAGVLTCQGDGLDLVPTADAMLSEASPMTNDGASDRIRVQERAGNRDQQGLFRWDLSGLPANSTITGASLTFEPFNFSGATPIDVELYENGSGWDESTVTFANAPAQGALIDSEDELAPNTGSWEVDVTTLATAAAAGDELLSVRLIATAPSVGSPSFTQFLEFKTKESTRTDVVQPRLRVCYAASCSAGTPCDDGDVNTENDILDGDCNCAGTPIDFSCTDESMGFTPVADTYVQDGTNSAVNFGTADRTLSQLRGGNRNAESLFRWDLSGLPAGAVVTSASVTFVPFNFNSTVPIDVELYPTATTWNETAVTWNTKPTLGTIIDGFTLAPGESWQVNIMDEVTAAMAGAGLLSFDVLATGPGVGTTPGSNFAEFLNFKTKESTNGGLVQPIIDVCYTLTCTPGTACDDGDVNTENDVLDGDCNCAGTPIDFTCGEFTESYDPVADVHVLEQAPDNNFGSDNTIRVQTRDANSRDFEGLFRWDLSGLPSDAVLLSARVNFPVYNFSSEPATPLDIEMYAVDNSWTENLTTWNTRPTLGTQISSATLMRGDNWEVNIFDQVTQALAGDNLLSVNLLATGPQVGTQDVNFTEFLQFKAKENTDVNLVAPSITLCFASTVLPVEWLRFTVTPLDKRNELRWATIQDQLVDYYAVERWAPGETSFRELVRLNNNGLAGERSFTMNDEAVDRNGEYAYRVRQVDVDGTYNYSPVRTVTVRAAANGITVTPNPVTDVAQIAVSAAAAGDSFYLSDQTGQIVRSGTLTGSTIKLSLEDLPAGVYLFTANGKDYRETAKLFIR